MNETDIIVRFPGSSTVIWMEGTKPLSVLAEPFEEVKTNQPLFAFGEYQILSPVKGIVHDTVEITALDVPEYRKSRTPTDKGVVIRARSEDVPDVKALFELAYAEVLTKFEQKRGEKRKDETLEAGAVHTAQIILAAPLLIGGTILGLYAASSEAKPAVTAAIAVVTLALAILAFRHYREKVSDLEGTRAGIEVIGYRHEELMPSVETRPVTLEDQKRLFQAMIDADERFIQAFIIFDLPHYGWKFSTVLFRKPHLESLMENEVFEFYTLPELREAYTALEKLKNRFPHLC